MKKKISNKSIDFNILFMSYFESGQDNQIMSINEVLESLRYMNAYNSGSSTYYSGPTSSPTSPVSYASSSSKNDMNFQPENNAFSTIAVGSKNYMSRAYYSYNTINNYYSG